MKVSGLLYSLIMKIRIDDEIPYTVELIILCILCDYIKACTDKVIISQRIIVVYQYGYIVRL